MSNNNTLWRQHIIAVFIALFCLLPTSLFAASITLQEALFKAYEKSPILDTERADLTKATGNLKASRLLSPFNPSIEGVIGQRDGMGGKATDWGVTVSQEIEVYGQRGDRMEVAKLRLKAAEVKFLRAKRLLAARVHVTFIEAVRAAEMMRIEETNVTLAKELLNLSQKQFDAGSTTQLDLNLANGELGHAERGLFMAQAASLVARSLLAETIGMSLDNPPNPVVTYTLPKATLLPLSSLLQSAILHRADLEAVRKSIDIAQLRIQIARSKAIPNITLSGYYEQEGGGDRLMGGGISLPIPLFNRAQAETASSRSRVRLAEAKAVSSSFHVRQQVVEAYAHQTAARSIVKALEERVMGTLEDNLSLLSRSFKAGKVGLMEVLLIRRQLLESKGEYIDALALAQRTHVELLLAAGLMPTISNH